MEWLAKWIAPQQNTDLVSIQDVPLENVLAMFGEAKQIGIHNQYSSPLQPVQYLRQTFHVSAENIQKAVLYITARGLYEAYINTNAVTDSLLNPGFTPYDQILEYQSYDVTAMLQEENVISIKLGDGWYRGRFGIMAFGANYGKEISVIYQIEITYKDGTTQIVTSDETAIGKTGPIVYSDFLSGEYYDALREDSGWMSLSEPEDTGWKACHLVDAPKIPLTASDAEPVRVVEEIEPAEILAAPNGDILIDFGVNLSGFVSFTLSCPPKGKKIELEMCEMLDRDGNYYNSIFGHDRDQRITYICKGEETETYRPSFTYFGFRYARITSEFEIKDYSCFKACVIASDLENAGDFTCSSEDLTQLQKNIRSSQLCNFISIPTDCPQREKAGWTGDVTVYNSTAVFNQNVKKFYEHWLASVRAEQLENGVIPIIVPYVMGYKHFQLPLMGSHTSSGWGDVMIQLPWTLYQEYADDSVLKDNFSAMKKWMDYIEEEAFNGKADDIRSSEDNQKYLWNTGFHFGDWLYPSSKDENGETQQMDGNFSTGPLTATVMYAMDTEIMASVCEVLGYEQLKEHYEALNKNIRRAYAEEYITEDGRLTVDLQGMYILALTGKVGTPEQQKKLAERLNQLIVENDYCLDAGFMSVRYLMDVLIQYGCKEAARRILYQEKNPSWIYEIRNGATSVWETWDAINTIGQPTAASFSHYAFGCIGEWMYKNLLGLRRTAPGWKQFEIAPLLDFDLTWAKGYHDTVQGRISFSWEKAENTVTYQLTVPDGCECNVVIPEGVKTYSVNDSRFQADSGILLGGGSYNITWEV